MFWTSDKEPQLKERTFTEITDEIIKCPDCSAPLGLKLRSTGISHRIDDYLCIKCYRVWEVTTEFEWVNK